MTIDIESLTLRELRSLKATLAALDGVTPSAPATDDAWDHASLPIGSILCVETVLSWIVGELVAVNRQQITLKQASWISQSGRYSEFAAGKPAVEVEPIPPATPVAIERSSVILSRRQNALELELK